MRDTFDNLTAEEFAQWLNQFIESEDPDAISLAALDEAARLQLAPVERMRIVLTGCIRDGQLIFDPAMNAPIMTSGNEVIIGGLHLVVDLRQDALAEV